MICIGYERLIDYADGVLISEEADAAHNHLAAGCRSCRYDLDWYLRFKSIAAGDASVEPPAWVLNRAFKAFSLQRQGSSLRERARRLIASLAFDSFGQAALAGVRSTETAERQLLYRAEPYSIDVKIAPLDPNQADMTGQILREGEMKFESVAGLRVVLMRNGATVSEVSTNDAGEFTCEAIERGRYDLRFDLPESSISIVGLPVGQ